MGVQGTNTSYFVMHKKMLVHCPMNCYDGEKGGGVMNLNNLKCLVDVVNAGSISGAARKNFVSQQALSDQIRRLEAHFQTPLLERTRPIRLTEAGRLVYDAAIEMGRAMDDLEGRVARLRAREPGLVISTGLTQTPPFLPRLVARFQEEMPGVEVRLVHPGFVREELDAPLPGADLIVGNMPFAPDVEGIELFHDVLCLVTSMELLQKLFGAEWPRHARRMAAGISLEACRAFPVDREIREKVLDAEGEVNFNARTIENNEMIVYRCSAGLEAAILPRHFAMESLGGKEQLRFFPIQPPQLAFRVGVGVFRGRPVSEAARAFIRIAREQFPAGGDV